MAGGLDIHRREWMGERFTDSRKTLAPPKISMHFQENLVVPIRWHQSVSFKISTIRSNGKTGNRL
jgi:hypothetical protein